MKFYNYLNEKSYTISDIPNDFWVVFDLEHIINELKTGKIKGLKGISSNSDIQFDFLGVARDAMLQMDSKELLIKNKITRIMYDNPHYLVSKNLWALRRLYSSPKKNWLNQVFGNLFERIQSELKGNKKHNQLFYDMGYYGFRNVDYQWSKKTEPTLKINNIKQLSIIVHKFITTIFSEKTGIIYDITSNELEKILYNSLKTIGKIYSTENEWVIKNDYLIVPKNSTLYILTQEPDVFDQKSYDFVKDNYKDDRIELSAKMYNEGLNNKDAELYRRMIKYDYLLTPIKDKYKIIKYNNIEFKRKQKEFWNKEK